MTDENANHKIDRLLDAIELLKIERRAEARQLLRELIQEDGNFEDAWLWIRSIRVRCVWTMCCASTPGTCRPLGRFIVCAARKCWRNAAAAVSE
jgi:hypothetical protein